MGSFCGCGLNTIKSAKRSHGLILVLESILCYFSETKNRNDSKLLKNAGALPQGTIRHYQLAKTKHN